jgi:hypothetical protein
VNFKLRIFKRGLAAKKQVKGKTLAKQYTKPGKTPYQRVPKKLK